MIEIQPSLIVWTVICFFILMLTLDKLLLKPILKLMDDRQKKIDFAELKKNKLEESIKLNEEQKQKFISDMTQKLQKEKEEAKQRMITEWERRLSETSDMKQKNIDEYRSKLENEKKVISTEIDSRTDELAEKFVTGFLSLADKI